MRSLPSSELGSSGGHPSFMNNVPDPLLSGTELPPFTFSLEKSEGRVIDGSYGKEATVEQLPISKALAGVSMRVEPGTMRELHWHATAAEWGYVLEGRCRTTVVDPEGRSETNEFGPGELWYFPRGHPHQIETLGDKPCHFILIFDNGYFSEFGTFSISDWIARVPRELLAKNLGVTPDALGTLPTDEVYFATGTPPPAVAADPLQGRKDPPLTHKYSLLSQAPNRVFPGGIEWRVDQSRFPMATTIAGVVLQLEPGALRELHWHPNAAEWGYLVSGRVRMTLFGSRGRYREATLEAGDVAYVPQGFGHSIENIGPGPAQMLIALNAGDYQVVDLTQWLASNPKDVLRTNPGFSDELIAKLPRRDAFIVDRTGR